MGYLIGEIVICLILAAIIGAIMAWLLRGLRCRANEDQLSTQLDQARSALETADTRGSSLETSLNKLRAEMESETRKLEDRIREFEIENGKLRETIDELEPLTGKIHERDAIIGNWERDFQNLQQQSEDEIARLKDNIAGLEPLQAELENSQQECARLKIEIQQLQAAVEQANQKAQQVSNLQNEIKQLQTVSAEIKKRDSTIEHLQGQLRSQTRNKDDEIARLQKTLQTQQRNREEKIESFAARLAKLEDLPQILNEREQEIKRLQDQLGNAEQEKHQELIALQAEIKRLEPFETTAQERGKQIERIKQELKQSQQNDEREIKKLQTRVGQLDAIHQDLQKHQTTIARLKTQLRSAMQDQAEISTIKVELKRRDTTIEDLRKQLAELKSQPKPAASRAQPAKRTVKKRLYTPTKKKDDLKRIYGIGPVMERTLNRLGVTSFEQIAGFTRKDIERVAEALQSFPDRIIRDNWIEGAKKEYRKKYGQKT